MLFHILRESATAVAFITELLYCSPMTDEANTFDWGDEQGRGEHWWRSHAKSAGVSSELAIKFVVAKWRGCSNTEAARQSGARGQATASGYRLARSREVARLYAVLNATEGDCIANVDAAEARRILSGLARGSDPSIRIRAVEALGKMDERDAAEAKPAGGDLAQLTAEFCRCGPAGALAVAALYLNDTGPNGPTLYGLPHLSKIAPAIRHHFPEAWRHMLADIRHQHHREAVERAAEGPVLDLASEFSNADTGAATPPAEAEADTVA
jgi:hypothetical protein